MSRREDGTWYSERHSAIKERNIDIFHLDEEELFIMEKLTIGSKRYLSLESIGMHLTQKILY